MRVCPGGNVVPMVSPCRRYRRAGTDHHRSRHRSGNADAGSAHTSAAAPRRACPGRVDPGDHGLCGTARGNPRLPGFKPGRTSHFSGASRAGFEPATCSSLAAALPLSYLPTGGNDGSRAAVYAAADNARAHRTGMQNPNRCRSKCHRLLLSAADFISTAPSLGAVFYPEFLLHKNERRNENAPERTRPSGGVLYRGKPDWPAREQVE